MKSRELLSNRSTCQDVLLNSKSRNFAALPKLDGLVDVHKLLQNLNSAIRKFHNIRRLLVLLREVIEEDTVVNCFRMSCLAVPFLS